MLRVSLIGNLGGDAELKPSQRGAMVATLRVAVNQQRTGPDGEKVESTEWFRVRAMGRMADFAQRLTKGTRVLVIGRLDIQHYQSRDGEPRVGFDVWADELQSLSGRGPTDSETADSSDEPGTARELIGAAARARPATATPTEDGVELDDLPF